MPFMEINQAQIYYRIYGMDKSDKVPIVLIHGSTIDGETDWGAVAPLLGQEYSVVVPDCRGHGRSSNPIFSYSFIEMAGDIAELIHKLGYGKVHVIGHSNGGNVALCLLMEYPDVVQSCVLQAANAFVSKDLVEREPDLFDPDRVAVEAPSWMNEMIDLHGTVHGSGYWRDLLKLTVDEIIRAPNYSESELSLIEKRILVIQGENDTVNNVGKHAQFLAKHIPGAILWNPESVGHNVHKEIPTKWIEEIINFVENTALFLR